MVCDKMLEKIFSSGEDTIFVCCIIAAFVCFVGAIFIAISLFITNVYFSAIICFILIVFLIIYATR